ncbi:sigma-54-dependent transcriptional regulator [Marinomonas balearica]|uniref:Two-component system repressor protein LuxO n=1 Tax=Marinomonas balearica TaxID=491947 RepID=A0A4R6ML95_9GAMM|nr:sigma-54 dependent transcriptional regulator [Marinomonas balearica]TDP01080.1 two-component system repressor protein LuxO [Marinomonas balearica]
MASREASILIIEDSQTMAELYLSYLESLPYGLTVVSDGKSALDALKKASFDVLLVDIHLPDMNGLEILKFVNSNDLPSSSIVITSNGSVEYAVEAMQHGAIDFIEKPFSASRLITTVQNALRSRQLETQIKTLKDNYERSHFEGFVGSSLAMQRVYNIIDSAAPSKATTFVTGESGTGKEVCAEAIHSLSQRKEKPFVALNCGAIPKDLMESEIFGHLKGSFTGAISPRQGAAERAHQGTLFLDEICEMDLDLQVKLLRFIQTGSFQKVGSSETKQVDVRFICATNRDPLKEVETGRFREDLYYRLHVIPIHLPPLRDREYDLILLARHFLNLYSKEENKHFSQFSPKAEVVINSYPWPGNIRQLQNVIRNIIVLNDGDTVDEDMLPPPLNNLSRTLGDVAAPIAPPMAELSRNRSQASAITSNLAPSNSSMQSPSLARFKASSTEDIRPLWIVEKEVIETAIELCDDNIPQAAAKLEVSPSTIYRKKQQWDAMKENSETKEG